MWWRLRAKSIRNVVWGAFNGRVQLKLKPSPVRNM